MGIDVVRHRGLGRSCTLLTVTPIDGEVVDARYTFFVLTDAETGEMSRMGLGFARDFCKQIEQDIPIWESKIYRDRPQLARGEGAITEFRSWARQSYEETSAWRSTPRRRPAFPRQPRPRPQRRIGSATSLRQPSTARSCRT